MSHQEIGDYKIRVFDRKTTDELKHKTIKLIEDLSFFGRSVSESGMNNRWISRRFHTAVKDGVITFAWNPYNKKSVIVIDPKYEITRLGSYHIKIRRR